VPEGVSRDRLISQLRDEGIETTIGTYCMSATTYYRSALQERANQFRIFAEHNNHSALL